MVLTLLDPLPLFVFPMAPVSVLGILFLTVSVNCVNTYFAYSNFHFSEAEACTENTQVVNCDDGYCSSGFDTDTFTITCGPNGPGAMGIAHTPSPPPPEANKPSLYFMFLFPWWGS